MPNPMLASLNQSKMSPIKQMMNMVKNASNPQAMLGQMIMQNPQMKQVIDYVNANGGDAKDAFYKLAQEKGVDPNEILSQLK